MKRYLSFISVFLLAALGVTPYAHSASFEAVPGEWVVKIKNEKLVRSGGLQTLQEIAQDLQAKFSSQKSSVKFSVRVFKTDEQFGVVRVLNKISARSLLLALNQDSRVEYAEPNFIYRAIKTNNRFAKETLPDDTQFDKLWGLRNTGQKDSAGKAGKEGADIRAAEAWADGVTGSRDIKVAIIDTGIDYTHADLKDNVDSKSGYNFITNKPDGKDDHKHGTHCAGTIGGMGNNKLGVVGVNWKVTMIPIKFLSATGGGSLEGAVQSIQYATKLGVKIMSNSWGGGAYSKALFDAISAAKNKGILFVAAAGNSASDNDATPSYPASYKIDNVLSVAATDNQDKLASFSNYGKATVHVAAPGVNVVSTVLADAYGSLSGTSMACPHVSGVAALLLSAKPDLTYSQIIDTLVKTSDKVDGLKGKVVANGRINAYNALHGI